jgi:TonB family protein
MTMKIKFYLILVPVLLLAEYVSAQTIADTISTAVNSDTCTVIDLTLSHRNESDSTDKWLMVVPDVLPSFKGGDINKFRRWVQLNVDYPLEAANVGLQGTVVISFVIERDGSVTNVQVVRSVHPALDLAAMRVVSRARGWEPAYFKGEPQRVRYSIPIIFGLQ